MKRAVIRSGEARDRAARLKADLARLAEDPAINGLLEEAAQLYNGTAGQPATFVRLHNVIERQHYRIADGDPSEIATPQRAVRGRAVLRQGIRPDTLLLIGQFDHWATPFAKDFGVPSLNALATMSMDLTDATGSGADIVRVKIARSRDGGRS